MQQYSSLPEPNSQVDTTISQLRAELWLERSLNQLQSRLNDCLLAVFTNVSQARITEAEIFQTVVNELNTALNASRLGFAQCVMGIALFQAQDSVGKVYYISHSPSAGSPYLFPEVRLKKGKKLRLELQAEITLKDLQELETQKPPKAWRLTDETGGMVGWLLMATPKHNSHGKTLTASQAQLLTLLMVKSVEQCVKTLTQLKQIQSLQQQSQNLFSTNQELKRTNQLKNQFLANTSHEIRTPLSSIIGFTHLLLAQNYDPTRERHREYLNIIQSSGKHLLALINDILDLSKIEANQLEVQWEKVDVPELCRNVLGLVKEKAGNKGLKLTLELDADVTTLVADSLRLKQMLLNLLFNALKFTNKGTVGLKVTRQDSDLHFLVWDTGVGISTENQALLFHPYVQIPNSSASQNEGTGLGLAVTRKLAEIHGGSVTVASEVNHGSRFTIILPLIPTGAVLSTDIEPEEEVTSSQSLPITPSSCRDILLVEDDLPNAELMKIHLSKLGYAVTCVNNAGEMWLALSQKQPAVILMDICLHDANGLDLVQQLRKKPEYQHIAVIAQTAMAMKGDREMCLAAGFNEYISKPIDLSLLTNLVAKYSQPS
ncbi:hybrid histidine kinase/response regulator HrmK [Anabaena sp. 4-3]|uniref:hybrid histidine kinase/response regulator HrmK n=1 Tax=Anabaena sp. 4-3 TaxID=1811979 RepID=UPI0008357C52|nr:hybrid histidine kinase/response regulator HrmK [Anabaena sp. 4-3]